MAISTVATATPAYADARISNLADVAFGTINSPVDQVNRQNVCAYSAAGFLNTLGYGVRATGSGSGGSFLLASGAGTLAYDVQWADSTGQTAGTQLQPGVLSSGYGNSALFQNCFLQTQGTASLIVTIRAAAISAATAGNYAGTLQIMIIPE